MSTRLQILLLLAGVLILVSVAGATQAAQEWVSLDGSGAGKPASIIFDSQASTPSSSTYRVTIHGFYRESVVGPDQRTYQRYWFPGLGMIAQEGAPDLPKIRFRLAIPTGAQTLNFQTYTIHDQRIYDSILPYPMPIPEGDQEGRPEQFTIDDSIYEGTAIYPPQPVQTSAAVVKFMGLVPTGVIEFYPVQWNPNTGEMRLIRDVTIVYAHGGTAQIAPAMTRHRARLSESRYDNWGVVESYFPWDRTEYIGSFLFVYAAALADSIQPLADQKRARGFYVTEWTTESIGTSCTAVRTAIGNWYDLVEHRGDCYVLLVGDRSAIDLCPVGTLYNGEVMTEDLYASPRGNDLDEEVFLGRLSVDDAADLGTQVRKILEYEDGWTLFGDYHKALLVAHLQGAPGKYEGCSEAVRTQLYSSPPTFITCYGSEGKTDSDIAAAINAGLGVVAYRGHAGSTGWSSWNLLGQWYDTTDVSVLTNGIMTPVVWSITCVAGNITAEDCMGEVWMESATNRAVAHYGSTSPSDTQPNHVLEQSLFWQVYSEDVTIHSHAIMLAEEEMVDATYVDNAWMYMLLGDPEMHIRREAVGRITASLPQTVPLCTAPPCWLDVNVMDDHGNPLPEAIVSAWMRPPPGKQTGGVLANRYSDASGLAHIPAEPTTEGWIVVTARDDFGGVLVDSVQVVIGTATPPARSGLALSARPSVLADRTTFHFGRPVAGPFRLEVYDARGFLVRRLDGRAGIDRIDWDGCDATGRAASSGIYLVRMQAESERLVTKVAKVR
ncbi:MAG: C25 family cysteine peptidase [Candidatus Krumholzibacteriia bacterium]